MTFAVLPPSNSRPNPLASQDVLYASVFAPGAICALERENGKLLWRRELPKYAGASVHLTGRKLLARTATTLFALDAESGETLWNFCPYGDAGETIYSSPSESKNCIYIGDRKGYLHCLDEDNGKTIWKVLTNRSGGNVNSTPLVLDGLVIVTTTAKTAAAYDTTSGERAWEQELDGPSIFGPVLHKRSVLAVSDSLYALSPRNGKIQQHLSWNARKVEQAASTGRTIVVMLRPDLPRIEISASNTKAMTAASRALMSSTAMCVITDSGATRKRQIAAFCAHFRYAATTRLLYLSHLGGVDLFRPENGNLASRLTTAGDTRSGIGLVDIRNGTIYVLTGDGTVHALRHP